MMTGTGPGDEARGVEWIDISGFSQPARSTVGGGVTAIRAAGHMVRDCQLAITLASHRRHGAR
jgi:hypothetical protein